MAAEVQLPELSFWMTENDEGTVSSTLPSQILRERGWQPASCQGDATLVLLARGENPQQQSTARSQCRRRRWVWARTFEPLSAKDELQRRLDNFSSQGLTNMS